MKIYYRVLRNGQNKSDYGNFSQKIQILKKQNNKYIEIGKIKNVYYYKDFDFLTNVNKDNNYYQIIPSGFFEKYINEFKKITGNKIITIKNTKNYPHFLENIKIKGITNNEIN